MSAVAAPSAELLALSRGVSSLASSSVLEAELVRLEGDATTSAGGAS